MALRNQPYIPLYVQDFMTDEKLNECSAQSAGVYIRLMCIMHKSDDYGTILLKQKYKQNNNFANDLPTVLPQQNSQQILFFAEQLSKQMPYSKEIIAESLTELINEKVVILENETLIQKRMVKDNSISEKRSSAGSKGAKTTNSKNKKDTFAESFADSFAAAKPAANSEYEYENETVIENNNNLNNSEKISKKIDPYCSAEKTNFENAYKKVFGDKPFLMREDCENLVDLLEQIEDFESTLEANLKKLKNINFDKIGYQPKADWFLKPKNYAALRMGTYDKQIEEKNENDGYNY